MPAMATRGSLRPPGFRNSSKEIRKRERWGGRDKGRERRRGGHRTAEIHPMDAAFEIRVGPLFLAFF